MKERCLMRVLFCKIQCPFICFCKPTSSHLYNSGPLKLENTPHVVPCATTSAVCDDASVHRKELSSSVAKEEEALNGKQEAGVVVLKSCMRKEMCSGHDETKINGEKKRVQWMDTLGKELAEIKEFESSETGDTDNEEENSRCFCAIL